jgi:hypothetical protein
VPVAPLFHVSSQQIQVFKMMAMRPNPKKAYKELRSNLLLFGTIIVAARASTFILHLYGKLK